MDAKTTIAAVDGARDFSVAFEQALSGHKAGEFSLAETAYRDILASDPRYFDALNMLGMLLGQTGRVPQGLELLSLALEQRPESVEALNNYGIANFLSGRLETAIHCCLRVMALKPDDAAAYQNLCGFLGEGGQFHTSMAVLEKLLKATQLGAEACNNLGSALFKRNRYREAVDFYQKAIAADANNAEAHNNLGTALIHVNRPTEAMACYQRAVGIRPDYADAYNNLTSLYGSLGRFEEGIASCRSALKHMPESVDAWSNLGNLYFVQEKYAEALSAYEKTVALDPEYAKGYNDSGAALSKLEKREQARICFEKAIQVDPRYYPAYNNLGTLLCELNRHQDAIEHYRTAAALKPDYADVQCNLGYVMAEVGRCEESLDYCRQAIALKPDYAEAYLNLGRALVELNQHEEAVQAYRKAIEYKPDYAEAYWNLSNALLALGDYANGWELYEWRWRHKKVKIELPQYSQPRLQTLGQVSGKTVLIYDEQGLGDSLQFVRYAPLLQDEGATVLLLTKPPLVSLLLNTPGIEAVVSSDAELLEFDCYVPLISLPWLFGTRLDSVPAEIPYVFADPSKIMEWKARLTKQGKPVVGLIWSGNARHMNDRNRSVALSQLRPLLELTDFQFISLQQEVRATDQAVLEQTGLRHFGAELKDFSDTAALVSCLDLVISVDTSVAHLAGALGKPLWMMLPFSAEWRWLRERADSPWYTSAKLFRQSSPGNWPELVERLVEQLRNQKKESGIRRLLKFKFGS